MSRINTLPRLLIIGTTLSFLTSSCQDKKEETGKREESKSDRRSDPSKLHGHLSYEELTASFRRPILSSEDVEEFEKATSALSTEQLTGLIAEFSADRNSSELRGAFVLLVSELARRDPSAALALFDPSSMSSEEAGWYQVVGILAENDPSMIQSWLLEDLKQSSPAIRKGILQLGIQAMVGKLDNDELVRFYAKLPKGAVEDSTTLTQIFNNYALKDPEAAEQTARSLLSGNDLDLAIQNIALTILTKDPDAAFRMTETITDQNRRRTILGMQYRQLAEQDLSKTLERFANLDKNLIEEIFRGDDGHFGESVTAQIAKTDPQGLLDLISKMTVSRTNHAIFERAVSSLTEAGESEMALQMINSIPEGGLQSNLFGKYIDQVITADPALALETFSELPAGKNRSHAFTNIGKSEAQRKTFQETIGTMNESIPQEDRSTFFTGAMPFLVAENPIKVRDFLDSEASAVLQPAARGQALERLGHKLTASDPANATTWLKELSADDQPFAMKGFANEMATSNILGLVDVLEALPRNETWAIGARTIANDLKNSDPATAAEWQGALKAAGFKE